MMTRAWCRFVGILAVLAITNSADAFNGRFGIWSSSSYYYYPATYAYYYYCPIPVQAAVPLAQPLAPRVVPVPPASSGYNGFAVPTAAPPSQTIEPPLAKPPMPGAKASVEKRYPMVVAVGSSPSNAYSCRVEFWNLSGRNRTLTVDGKNLEIPRDRSITVDVERRFVWQLEDRSQRVERVPDALTKHDVVIRD